MGAFDLRDVFREPVSRVTKRYSSHVHSVAKTLGKRWPSTGRGDRRDALRPLRACVLPAKLNLKQEAHLVSLVHSGEYSRLEVADLFGVDRSTVYRAIERQRITAKANLAEASARR
jgi:hypothetical protein